MYVPEVREMQIWISQKLCYIQRSGLDRIGVFHMLHPECRMQNVVCTLRMVNTGLHTNQVRRFYWILCKTSEAAFWDCYRGGLFHVGFYAYCLEDWISFFPPPPTSFSSPSNHFAECLPNVQMQRNHAQTHSMGMICTEQKSLIKTLYRHFLRPSIEAGGIENC